MAVAIIQTTYRNRREVKQVVSEHLWYDPDTKQLQKFVGGKLVFSYANGKMSVKTEPLAVVGYVTRNDRDDVREWLAASVDELQLEVVNSEPHELIVSFPDEKTEDVRDALHLTNFLYEIV